MVSHPCFAFAKQVMVTVTGSVLPTSSKKVGEFGSDAGSYTFEWANKQVSLPLSSQCANNSTCEVKMIVEDEMGYIEKIISIKNTK